MKVSLEMLQNRESSSVRQREMLDTLESSRSVALGKKVGLIAARRTGRLRGSNLNQQSSNIEPSKTLPF